LAFAGLMIVSTERIVDLRRGRPAPAPAGLEAEVSDSGIGVRGRDERPPTSSKGVTIQTYRPNGRPAYP